METVHDHASGTFDDTSGIVPGTPVGLADPLSDALRAIRLSGALFFLADATTPWCVDIPKAADYAGLILPGPGQVISYHIAIQGEGLARIPGHDPVQFSAGDVIVLPHGDAYAMANAEGVPPEFDYDQTLHFFRDLAAGRLPFVIPEGGGGEPRTRVICGFLGCDTAPFNPVLGALPPLLHIRKQPGQPGDLLDRLTEMAVLEAETPRAGGESIRLGLTELMFVELLRRHVATLGPEAPGWLAGLAEPVTARVLGLLHGDPARAWTLDVLAREAGTSRSVLAEKFTARIGVPPMRYLKHWRIQRAARMLTDGPTRIAAVAEATGFSSEAVFSRAFKQVTGVSPAAWRDDAAT